MTKLHYHQRALSLAKTMPSYSEEAAQQLTQIVASLGIALPQSVVEWLCLDPDARLFHPIGQVW